jgi:hypothetical protein
MATRDTAKPLAAPCPICGREMIPGPSVDRHHWVPRSRGGDACVTMHRVCHRMLHRVFDERQLAEAYHDAATIRAHPDIRRFVKWLQRKPPDYVDWPRTPDGSAQYRRARRRRRR